MALFLSNILSDTFMIAPYILLLSLVINCMPSTNSFSKSFGRRSSRTLFATIMYVCNLSLPSNVYEQEVVEG